MDIEIVSYEPRLAVFFKALNYEWIQKYFEVEPSDRFTLENPEEAILAKGGQIYFARLAGEIVGTCSVSRINTDVIELGKLAVRPDHQRKGIGRATLQFCIEQARQNNYKVMTLYSSTQLVNAINMYIEFGFRLTPKTDFHSKRANIKMCLPL